jgi:hypothetical protein
MVLSQQLCAPNLKFITTFVKINKQMSWIIKNIFFKDPTDHVGLAQSRHHHHFIECNLSPWHIWQNFWFSVKQQSLTIVISLWAESSKYQFYGFSLTRLGLEITIYRTRDEHEIAISLCAISCIFNEERWKKIHLIFR